MSSVATLTKILFYIFFLRNTRTFSYTIVPSHFCLNLNQTNYEYVYECAQCIIVQRKLTCAHVHPVLILSKLELRRPKLAERFSTCENRELALRSDSPRSVFVFQDYSGIGWLHERAPPALVSQPDSVRPKARNNPV